MVKGWVSELAGLDWVWKADVMRRSMWGKRALQAGLHRAHWRGWLHQLGDWEGQIESRDIRLNPVANGEMV